MERELQPGDRVVTTPAFVPRWASGLVATVEDVFTSEHGTRYRLRYDTHPTNGYFSGRVGYVRRQEIEAIP